MKSRSLFSATAIALVFGAMSVPAFAKTTGSVSCSGSTATIGNAGYISCQGPTLGNVAPGQVNTATFAGHGTFSLVGKSDDAGFGPFGEKNNGATSGTLTFDSVQKGYFVLGIKGGPDFSLYLFNGGTTGIQSLAFDTNGITKGNGGAGPGLSHFALFTSPVPEPETYVLMLAGLGVMGFVAKRRLGA